MRTTHQKHRQPRRNATSAPGIMMSSPYPISAESAGRLVMESDRLGNFRRNAVQGPCLAAPHQQPGNNIYSLIPCVPQYLTPRTAPI